MIDFLIWVLLIALIIGGVWFFIGLDARGELMAGIWVVVTVVPLLFSYFSSNAEEESLDLNTAIEQTSESVSSQADSMTLIPLEHVD